MCCKILERIISNALLEHLEKHNLLTPEQFEYRGKNVEDQLLLTYEGVGDFVDSERVVFNFSKAFDRVSHAEVETAECL